MPKNCSVSAHPASNDGETRSFARAIFGFEFQSAASIWANEKSHPSEARLWPGAADKDETFKYQGLGRQSDRARGWLNVFLRCSGGDSRP
jgi:hypothetical protein